MSLVFPDMTLRSSVVTHDKSGTVTDIAVPKQPHSQALSALYCFSKQQVTESWVGPGNEASSKACGIHNAFLYILQARNAYTIKYFRSNTQ